MRFEQFVEINPRVDLEKEQKYPYVGMAEITPGRRYVYAEEERVYEGGGTKFSHGDILFARITPSLEHGKIAQYKAKAQAEEGMGSTEFFVFRDREGVSDLGYVYYLSLTDTIRKPAELSMTGASGRQRADLDAVRNVEIAPPPLPTQRKIAAILSAYDDLIENNSRRIALLEEMAQLLYREWFIHFRFPGHEEVAMVEFAPEQPSASVSPVSGLIPEGWEVKRLEEVCHLTLGVSPRSEHYNEEGDGLPFHQGVSDFGRLYPITRRYCSKIKRTADPGDILFSVRAPVGRLNIADRKIVIGRGLHAIRSKAENQSFIFLQLSEKFKEEDSVGSGTIFKSVTKSDMLGIELLIPSPELIEEFDQIVDPIYSGIKNLTDRNNLLRRTRDLLLPRLVSGELDVADLPIAMEAVDSQ